MPPEGTAYAKALWQDGARGILGVREGRWLEQHRALTLQMYHLLSNQSPLDGSMAPDTSHTLMTPRCVRPAQAPNPHQLST